MERQNSVFTAEKHHTQLTEMYTNPRLPLVEQLIRRARVDQPIYQQLKISSEFFADNLALDRKRSDQATQRNPKRYNAAERIFTNKQQHFNFKDILIPIRQSQIHRVMIESPIGSTRPKRFFGSQNGFYPNYLTNTSRRRQNHPEQQRDDQISTPKQHKPSNLPMSAGNDKKLQFFNEQEVLVTGEFNLSQFEPDPLQPSQKVRTIRPERQSKKKDQTILPSLCSFKVLDIEQQEQDLSALAAQQKVLKLTVRHKTQPFQPQHHYVQQSQRQHELEGVSTPITKFKGKQKMLRSKPQDTATPIHKRVASEDSEQICKYSAQKPMFIQQKMNLYQQSEDQQKSKQLNSLALNNDLSQISILDKPSFSVQVAECTIDDNQQTPEPATQLKDLIILYRSQTFFWKRYDRLKEHFDSDPSTNLAPIPKSGAFLLLHLHQSTDLQNAYRIAKQHLQLARQTIVQRGAAYLFDSLKRELNETYELLKVQQ